MERGPSPRSIRFRVLTLALTTLEIVAQVFSLAMFPSAGASGGPCLSTCRCAMKGNHVSAGSASCFVRRVLRELFASALPDDDEPEDGDRDQVDWVQIEVVTRQKDNPSVPPLAQPSPVRSLGVVRARPPALVTAKPLMQPAYLCRLTC